VRLFIAVELPDPVRQHLRDVQSALRPDAPRASWTRPDNLHLTLKFLGEVRDQQFPSLADSLSRVSVDGNADLYAAAVECFPERGPVRIVAAALEGTLGPLKALHAAIEQRCAFLGFEREARSYRPHVTLARARPTLPPAVRERLTGATTATWPGPTFVVPEFVLMESRLKPSGAEYLVAARFPLQPPAG
jgi:2'-5' RNA ligase